MRILVVEDGIDNQTLISHILRSAGAKVEVAANGREGVEVNAYGAAGDIGFKKSSFVGNGRYGAAKVARAAAALKSFGNLSFGTGVNENYFDSNGAGNVSGVVRGF